MTVDVEDYFHVSAFARTIRPEAWNVLPSRVEANTRTLIDLFDSAGVRGTFFVLGWVAQRHPGIVEEIAARGHEIGCHGYSHRLVYETDPTEFRRETSESRKLLQDRSGQPVLGYRAASFSITRRSLWALDVLVDLGFRYDSSVFPVVHDRYGIPGAPRRPYRHPTTNGTIVEFPPTTLSLGRLRVPVGGGGYLRLFPARVSHWAIRLLNERERLPAVVYVHPWEIDPDQPRVAAPALSRLRHYTNLATTARKLGALTASFRFGRMDEVLESSGLAVRGTLDATPSVAP